MLSNKADNITPLAIIWFVGTIGIFVAAGWSLWSMSNSKPVKQSPHYSHNVAETLCRPYGGIKRPGRYHYETTSLWISEDVKEVTCMDGSTVSRSWTIFIK